MTQYHNPSGHVPCVQQANIWPCCFCFSAIWRMSMIVLPEDKYIRIVAGHFDVRVTTCTWCNLNLVMYDDYISFFMVCFQIWSLESGIVVYLYWCRIFSGDHKFCLVVYNVVHQILIWWEWSYACSVEGSPENETPSWAIKSDPRCTRWCNYRWICYVMDCTLACKWRSWGWSNQLHGDHQTPPGALWRIPDYLTGTPILAQSKWRYPVELAMIQVKNITSTYTKHFPRKKWSSM